MPLFRIDSLSEHQFVGYWHLEETIEELSRDFDFTMEEDFSLITHPAKLKEWLATRWLMREVVRKAGGMYTGIVKDKFGKPWLKDSNSYISVSHCFPRVVVILDTVREVGIDLERSRDQIDKIAPRFLSAKEMEFSNSTEHHMIMWAAKETLYKLHGRKSLVFREQLLIDSFDFEGEGTIIGRIIDQKEEVHNLYYQFVENNEYVLVHSVK